MLGSCPNSAILVDLNALFDRRGNAGFGQVSRDQLQVRVQVEYHEVGKFAKFDGSFAVLFENVAKLARWSLLSVQSSRRRAGQAR